MSFQAYGGRVFGTQNNFQWNSPLRVSYLNSLIIVPFCPDVQRRAETQGHMPRVRGKERLHELFLDSVPRGERFAPSDQQRGTVLSSNETSAFLRNTPEKDVRDE